MVVYGIKNCNSVKSALDWLKKKKVDFEFHDYKSKGITAAKLKEWSKQVGWERLVNKKGMTWRKLDDMEKTKVTNLNAAISLMTKQTSVIKRPLIEVNGEVVAVGFDEKEYKKAIKV
ncbi:MAG TPA: ArsC family reductase [Cyclobacteriaceae bacterium]